LPSLDEDNERRRSIFAAYRDAAPDGISFVGHKDERFVGHLCVAAVADRERVRDRLRSAGVATDIHYPVLDCDQPMMQGRPMRSLDLSTSRWAVDHILTLPCFPELTDGEVSYVCEQLSSLAV
jgi:aminotransferase EvaB